MDILGADLCEEKTARGTTVQQHCLRSAVLLFNRRLLGCVLGTGLRTGTGRTNMAFVTCWGHHASGRHLLQDVSEATTGMVSHL